MAQKWAVAILAAGKGSRLKVETPKPVLPVCGREMVHYIIDTFQEFDPNILLGIVIGYKSEVVRSGIEKEYKNIQFATQKELNGTAGALKSFFDDCPQAMDSDYLIVSCADTPLLQSDVLSEIKDYLEKNHSIDGVAVSFEARNPYGLGRIVRGDKGFRIIEEKDTNDEQKKITEVNSGLYILKMDYVKKHLFNIDNKNKSGEFYLSDLFQIGLDVEAFKFNNEDYFLGVNTFDQVAIVEKKLRARKINSLQKNGVYFENPENTLIDWGVEIASGTRVESGVSLKGKTIIGEKNLIENGCVIKNSHIGNENKILAHSYFEEVRVGDSNAIGPFARLRVGTEITKSCKLGNFVETKKSVFKEGSKASHLSYIGDAEIGEKANIGCGFITCNYDGANKHKTKIGKGTFIGSDVQVIAPISIGDKCFIAAGSTINDSMSDGSFAIARSKQSTKEGMAKRFLKTKK